MTDQAVTLTPIVLTPEQRASALQDAQHVTPELINELKPYTTPMPESIEESTRANYDYARRYLSALMIYRDQPIDCATPAGLADAKEIRFRLRKLRTTTERLRLEGNRPYMDRIDANNDAQKQIEDLILPIEKRYDDAIKAEEAAARDRKAQAEREAAARAQVITGQIAAIAARSNFAPGTKAEAIAAAIIDLTSDTLDAESFGDRYGEAVVAKDQALFRMEAAQKTAEESEAREKLMQEQAAELARRDAADAERKAVDDAKEAERQAQEKILRRIANIRGITAWAIKASAVEIREQQEALDATKQADFHPFEREAMAAHAEVTDALPALLAMAEQRERTQAEREARELREQQIEARFRMLRSAVAVCDQPGTHDDTFKAAADLFGADSVNEENYGDRLAEAQKLAGEQMALLVEVQAKAAAAAEQARAERAERDRAAAEKAAADAKRSRTIAVMAEQCTVMFIALTKVTKDANFQSLDSATQAAVMAPLSAIVKAQEGGAA